MKTGDVRRNQQRSGRLLALWMLCLFVLAMPLAAMDHPPAGLDAPVGWETPPSHHDQHKPACQHDSHHGGALALLPVVQSEWDSADTQSAPPNSPPAPALGVVHRVLLALHASPDRQPSPAYLLTRRLRL